MTAPERPEVSIVIPAFNEAERLPRTLEQLTQFLATQPWRCEIVLSDDGSTDDTVACFEQGVTGLGRAVVRAASNRGKGHAVRLGMRAAQGAIRVMCDADGSMPAEELPRLVEPIRQGEAPVVIGSRYLGGGRSKGQPAWRRAWSRLAHEVVKRTVVPGIEDTHCGYKAFTAKAAEEIFSRATIDGWAFDLEVLALARHRGYRVLEVPVEWTDDGRSRVRALRDLPRIVGETARIRSNLRSGLYGPKVDGDV